MLNPERDAYNRNEIGDGAGQMAEREPPAEENEPDNVTECTSGPVPTSSLPASSRRLTASRPNGQKEKLPITKHARPHGIPTMDMKAIRPTSHQASPMKNPPSTNHRILPISRNKPMSFLRLRPDAVRE